jgi:ParB family chromosome partitioning protein
MTSDTNKRLGRGLGALITNAARPTPTQVPTVGQSAASADANRIPIASILPNPFQPRKEFKPADLKELEDSLRVTGLLQPITVRPARSGTGFELAAGERRLRAATNLGWTDIPAVVRDMDDQELLAVALVENLQRSDLNPIEEAQGYARLLAEFGLTQQSVAERVGKERSTVANMLRLLQLPVSIRSMLQSSNLTLGHARALLSLSDESEMQALANEIVALGISVREVERRVRDRKPTPKKVSQKRTPAPQVADAEVRLIEEKMRKTLQTDTRIILSGPDRGSINISFYSADDLERLLDIMLGSKRNTH